MIDPWAQQINEGDEAFRRFAYFRDLGPGRKHRQVAEKFGVGVQTIRRTAADERWGERVRAWDNEMDRVARERLLLERSVTAQKHFEIANGFLEKVAERLETLDVAMLTPRDLASMLDVAVKVGRLSMDMATNINENQQSEKTAANDAIRDMMQNPDVALLMSQIGETVVSERPVGQPHAATATPRLSVVQSSEPGGLPQ